MGGWSERVTGQTGFFDVERRLEAISAKGDPLETIKKIVRWEDFRYANYRRLATQPVDHDRVCEDLRRSSPRVGDAVTAQLVRCDAVVVL